MKIGDLVFPNCDRDVPLWDYLGQEYPRGNEQMGVVHPDEVCLIIEVSDHHTTTQREVKVFSASGVGWSRDVYFTCATQG